MVKELAVSVKESVKEFRPLTRAALPGRGNGERNFSSVKVFNLILSPGKAREIKPCASLMKELKVFIPICVKNKKYREIGIKRKIRRISRNSFNSFTNGSGARERHPPAAPAEQAHGHRRRSFLFPRREKTNLDPAQMGGIWKGVQNEHFIKTVRKAGKAAGVCHD